MEAEYLRLQRQMHGENLEEDSGVTRVKQKTDVCNGDVHGYGDHRDDGGRCCHVSDRSQPRLFCRYRGTPQKNENDNCWHSLSSSESERTMLRRVRMRSEDCRQARVQSATENPVQDREERGLTSSAVAEERTPATPSASTRVWSPTRYNVQRWVGRRPIAVLLCALTILPARTWLR